MFKNAKNEGKINTVKNVYYIYAFRYSPKTCKDAFAVITPTSFFAMHVYSPWSSVLMSTMKNISSDGKMCILRSLAAGKSSPPSFCSEISGCGKPAAAQSRRAVVPDLTTTFDGVFKNVG